MKPLSNPPLTLVSMAFLQYKKPPIGYTSHSNQSHAVGYHEAVSEVVASANENRPEVRSYPNHI